MIEAGPRQDTIERLVARAAQGDDGAFELLFRAHHRHVYAFCRTRVSHAEDAEDCAQEAFSRAWSSLRRGVEPDEFRPWLFTIAARLCHSRRVERAVYVLGIDVEPKSPPFEDGVIDRIDATVENALADLQPTERSIVQMTQNDGLPIGAVARKLGLPPRRVEGMLFDIRRALRARLR